MGLKDEILARADIAEVVGQYVALTPAGREFKGRCPFHEEKSASFHVNPEKGLFHCFGCRAGGSVISFVERIENLEFAEALEWLARRYNIDASRYSEKSGPVGEKERLYRINEAALKFFREKLKSHEGETARAYLAKRSVSELTAADFDLGYAPREWQALTDFLLSHGAVAAEVERLGLIKPRRADSPGGGQGGFYDSFRHRLIYPIRSVTGRVIGFAGRALADDDNPKYLNVTNTPLYDKSSVLYNLDRAKGHMRDDGAVVVEGYMDVIGLAAAGVKNAVASCGTALTPQHVRLLARYTDTFHLAFDGDKAGRGAAWGAGKLFLAAGHNARVIPLPPGVDPDDLVKERGESAWRGLLLESQSVVRFWLEHQRSEHPSAGVGEKRQWITQLAGLYQGVADPLLRAQIVQEIAGALALGASEVGGLLDSERTRFSGANQRAAAGGGQREMHNNATHQAREKALLQGAAPTEQEVMRRLFGDEEFRLIYSIEDKSEWFGEPLLREIYCQIRDGREPEELLHEPKYSAELAALLSVDASPESGSQIMSRHKSYWIKRRIDQLIADGQLDGNSDDDPEAMRERLRQIQELKSQIREVRGIGGTE